MNKKKEYEEVLESRRRDVEVLLLYFTIGKTRKFYKERDGEEFVLNSYESDMRFIHAYWDKLVPRSMQNKVKASEIQNRINGMGIHWKLMNKVVGKFRGKDIGTDEIMKGLDKWKLTPHGQKYWNDKKKGEKKLLRSWSNRWELRDWRLRNSMLCDERYENIETIPGASRRVVEIVAKWEAKSQSKEVGEKEVKGRGRPKGMSKATILKRLATAGDGMQSIVVVANKGGGGSNDIEIDLDIQKGNCPDDVLNMVYAYFFDLSMTMRITKLSVGKNLTTIEVARSSTTNIDADVVEALGNLVKKW